MLEPKDKMAEKNVLVLDGSSSSKGVKLSTIDLRVRIKQKMLGPRESKRQEILAASSSRIVLEQLTHVPKLQGSNPGAAET